MQRGGETEACNPGNTMTPKNIIHLLSEGLDSVTINEQPSRPVITACVDCGENAPEHGMVCDECRLTALND